MSENAIDIDAFLAETTRLDALRSTETYGKVGGAALTHELPPLLLEELTTPADKRSEVEKAEDIFDARAIEYFDAEQTNGYYLFSAEGGRLALSSEVVSRDDDGKVRPHTVLAAKLVEGAFELAKFRQHGADLKKVTIFPEDWEVMKQAIAELGRVNDRLESELE